MGNKMKNKNIMPYSFESRDDFSLLGFERKVIARLEEILKKEKGIFLLCGHQGVGKTSLKNIAVYFVEENKTNKDCIIIEIPFFSGSRELYREIVVELLPKVEKKLEELKDEVRRNFWKGLEQIEKKFECTIKGKYRHEEVFRVLTRMQKRLSDDTYFDDILAEIRDQTNNFLKISTHKKKNIWEALFTNPLKKESFYDGLESVCFKEFFKILQRVEEELKRLQNLYNIYREMKDLMEKFNSEIQTELSYSKQEMKNIYTSDLTLLRRKKDQSIQFGIGKQKLKLESGLRNLEERNREEKEERSSKDVGMNVYQEKRVYTDEEKVRKLIVLLMELGKTWDISLIIDELDKYPVDQVIHIINENKRLFFDCNLTTIFITDIFSAIYVEENSRYLSRHNLVIVRSLNLLDSIIRVKNKEIYRLDDRSNDFFDCLKRFYASKLNNREMMFARGEEKAYIKAPILFYCFIHSKFYLDLRLEYREVFIEFFWKFFNLLEDCKRLTWEEFDLFVAQFLRKANMDSIKVQCLFYRLTEIMKTRKWEFNFCFGYFSDYESPADPQKFSPINQTLDEIARELITIFGKEEISIEGIKVFDIERKLNGAFDSMMKYLIKIYKNSEYRRLDYREIRWMKEGCYTPDEGIDDARRMIEKENIVGAILFYPYNDKEHAYPFQKPLQNGILVGINDFREFILYPYIGYIGLHSHKQHRMEEFKKFMTGKGIKIYEVDEGRYDWSSCFGTNGDEYKDKIFEICQSNISKWLEEWRYSNFSF